jgi:hypothetical protein
VVDVARAVREDLGRRTRQRNCASGYAEQRVVVDVLGDAVQAEPLLLLEVDEQQPDVGG